MGIPMGHEQVAGNMNRWGQVGEAARQDGGQGQGRGQQGHGQVRATTTMIM